MEQSSSQIENRKEHKRSTISINTRIEVWWPLEKQYFPGKLTNQRDDDCWKVEYDDGDQEWILLSRERFRLLHPEGTLEAQEQEEKKMLLDRVRVGNRVEVYWEPYNLWYAGTVKDIELGRTEEYLIAYDTKNETWEDLFQEEFRLLEDQGETPVADNVSESSDTEEFIQGDQIDPALITAGRRIAVFFDDEDGGNFYHGKVLSDLVVKGKAKKFATIRFDDGEKLDVDLAKTDIKLLNDERSGRENSSERVEESKFSKDSPRCRSSARKSASQKRKAKTEGPSADDEIEGPRKRQPVKSSASRPERTEKSADADRSQLSLAANKMMRSTPSRKITPSHTEDDTKRKTTAFKTRQASTKHTPDVNSKLRKAASAQSKAKKTSKQALKNRRKSASTLSPPSGTRPTTGIDLLDICPLCQTTEMERPRGLECGHTFCRECVIENCHTSRACPLCKFPLGDRIHLYNRSTFPDAFREVACSAGLNSEWKTFASASAATLSLAGSCVIPARTIIDACNSKVAGDKVIFGNSWAFAKDVVPLCSSSEQKSIEQRAQAETRRRFRAAKAIDRVCPASGRVMESFESAKVASDKLRLDAKAIRRVARGQQRLTGGCFFRYSEAEVGALAKSSDCVSHDAGGTRDKIQIANGFAKPIEMVCLDSGDVLQSFSSISEASRATKISTQSISGVCGGEKTSAGGFFFRYKVSGQTASKEEESLGVTQPGRKRKRDCLTISHEPANPKRSIEQVCIESGMLLATYSSVADLCDRLGLDRAKMSRVAQGVRAGKFYFRHEGSNLVPLASRPSKKIEQLCLETGALVSQFDSISKASRALRISSGQISRAVRGEIDSAGGYCFRLQGSKQQRNCRQVELNGALMNGEHDSAPATIYHVDGSLEAELRQGSTMQQLICTAEQKIISDTPILDDRVTSVLDQSSLDNGTSIAAAAEVEASILEIEATENQAHVIASRTPPSTNTAPSMALNLVGV